MGRLALLLALAPLAGCAMAQSTLLSGSNGVGCQSSAGAYSLSKTFVVIEIKGGEGNYALQSVRLERRADKRKKYCLDYLASATSTEAFAVQRNERGLLLKVTANSKDQSAVIAKTFAQTVFTLISQNPSFDEKLQVAGRSFEEAASELPTPYKAEFDPFNTAQAAVVNDSMKRFGFCLMIEEQSVSRTHRDIDSYCDNPLGRVSLEQALAEAHTAEREAPPVRDVRGILYRPRVPYVMYLFVKRNLKVRGGWVLRASEAVHIENRSPVLGIGIDRAFFTDRKTTLTFDEGALRDIDIDKKSELAGLVEVPLYIAQGIAALPANIIQVKINQTNNTALLIDAQQQLILAERQYRLTLKELQDLRTGAPGPTPPAEPQNGRTAEQPEPVRPVAQGQENAEMKTCVARNQSGWGTEEAKRFCTCVLVECRASGLGSDTSCTSYCSRVRTN